jgi:hypothetical protein
LGARKRAKRLSIVNSDANAEPHGYAGDLMGRKLPDRLGPSRPAGRMAPKAEPA